LNLDALTAARTTGEPLANGRTFPGRIFIIEHEPLLDTALAPPGMLHLTLYGKPNHEYQLQSSVPIGANPPWDNEISVTLPGTYQTFERSVMNESSLIFRAREQ
jgi:hypothetical protein